VGILRGLLKTLLTQTVELAIEKRVGFWNFLNLINDEKEHV
jgi:hypothetical protein